MEDVIDEVLDAPNSDDEAKEEEGQLAQKNDETFDNILISEKEKRIETRECMIIIKDINHSEKHTLTSKSTNENTKGYRPDKSSISQTKKDKTDVKGKSNRLEKILGQIGDNTANRDKQKRSEGKGEILEKPEAKEDNDKLSKKSAHANHKDGNKLVKHQTRNETKLAKPGKTIIMIIMSEDFLWIN